VQPTNLGMDQASSPSIGALPGGGFEIAFQANTHLLWTVERTGFDNAGVGRPVDGAVMTPGTLAPFVAVACIASPTLLDIQFIDLTIQFD
jgi:hypothetical protein